jgi:hypothetical protein
MDSIPIHFVFINGLDEVTHMTTEMHDLEESNDSSILSEGAILEIIQQKRCLDNKNTRYAFEGMKSFVISMEPQFLTDFIHAPDQYIETNTIAIPQNIVFPSSVFLFHKTNCLWMFFQEMERILPTTSILKTNIKKKITKKVRISDCLPSRYGGTSNKTRRQPHP